MVPVQVCALKHDVGNDAEDGQRDTLLYNLQLDEVEGAAVLDKAQTVGWHLTAVLEEGNAPREDDDAEQRPVRTDTRLRQFKMPIPSKRHEDVA